MTRFRTLIIVVVVIAAGVALSRTDAGQILLGRWSFTEWARVDTGTYFRLKVKLAYKGELQDFDIVIGCNVHTIRYKDASGTYEAGLVPTLFGRRMTDGHGLVVRPPNACDGETTANGGVPADFMPIIIVYDDAETMGFGTAYLNDEAYQSPQSVLSFGGATIAPATRAEFDAFRTAQPNLVQPAMYFSDSPPELKKLDLAILPILFGQRCYGYARFRLLGEERAAAQKYWPADHPPYWRATGDAYDAVYNPSVMTQLTQSDGPAAVAHTRFELMLGLEADAPDYGAPTKSGNGLVKRWPAYPVSVYPNIGGWVQLPWPTELPKAEEEILHNGPHVGASIDYRGGATRGFAYCRGGPEDYPNGNWDAYKDPLSALQLYRAKPGMDLIDGALCRSSWTRRSA